MSMGTGPSNKQSKLSPEKTNLLEERLQRAKVAVSGGGISPRPRGVPAPLSFAQRRLWFLEQLEPGTNTYNVPRALRFKGELNVTALEQTINEIKRRHEVLRTVFRVVDGQPVQEVMPLQATSLSITDLIDLGEDDRAAQLRQLAWQEAQRPVDLVRGPLMRTSLLRLSNDEYVLLITLHHIVSDGWSTGVLMREMETLYKAYSTGRPSPLPEMRIQYADFAYWQRQWLTGSVLEEQLSYWRENLRDLPASLNLPTDLRPNARRSFRGANKGITLTRNLTEAVKNLARQEEATLFMTLLTAFKVLLYRYSGQEDIVVGTPIANRNRVEIEGLIGFFINSLALRTDVSGEPTFRELLRKVKDGALEAYAHQDLPFEMLVEELQPERSLNHTPLFQVMFVLQNAPRDVMELPGLSISLSEIVTETAKYDLFMYAVEVKEGLHIGLQYSAEMFDRSTIDTLLDRYRLLLEAAVADPDTRISELSIIDPTEAKRILVDWNDETEYPQDRCIHQLFEAQASRCPEAVALSIAGTKISYAQLNDLSNRIAHGLRRLGITSTQPVAVMLDTSVNQIAAALGVLKAGGCFVCLDPNYPAARLRQLMFDAQPACLISESACLKDHPAIAAQFRDSTPGGVIVDLTRPVTRDNESDLQSYGWDWFEASPADNPEPTANPTDPAYIVYTSGSTGKPKGIVQSHASFCQFIEWQAARFNIGPKMRVAQWASVSYDASYCEIFGALCFGATLCLVDRSTRYDARALISWLKAERISLLQVVPSFCRLILDSINSETDETGANPLPDLRVMLLAGEVVPTDLASNWLTRFSNECTLFNLYGPTECVLAAFYRIEEVGANQKSIPAGHAIAGRQILILDRNGRLCPTGIRGEVYVRSKYLASGYFRQPALTKKSFIQNPLHDDYPDPVYRTGDVGRWLPDGNMEFSGRVDNQVKIRGMRVELEEIESVLSRHPAVSECAVVADDSSDLDKRLLAYVCVSPKDNKSGEQSSESALGAQHVMQYQDIYNEVYSISGTFSENDPGISLRVWTSSYTGKPFDEDEIVECVNDTVGRILSLSPRRALEIACGTGLLLFRIAPHCSRYFGTDISSVGVEYLQKELDKLDPPISGVTLQQKAAHEINQIPEEKFDAIILNDVVPYFPTLEYLVEVIENSIRMIDPPGFIFLGGLRALALLEAFHTSVQLGKAPASLKKEQLQQRIRRQMVSEKELLIDPDFFIALKQRIPAISHVQLELKGGRYHNEVTRFQYDAVLFVAGQPQQQTPYRGLDWEKDGLTIAALKKLLDEERPDILRIKRVPNARVIDAAKAVELIHSDESAQTASDLRDALRTVEEPGGVDPEAFWLLSKELPYGVNIDWWRLGADGSYNVVLNRRAGGEAPFNGLMPQPTEADLSRPWKEFSNNPLQEKFRARLVPELRNFVAANLPQHMVPSAFIFLDDLPRTPTGKVYRGALLKLGASASEMEGDYEPPRTELESLIADVWKHLLRVDRVGRSDSFFALGGHSLLATQVINKVGQLCSVNVPLRNFFESPTVASLAAQVEEARIAARIDNERLSQIIGRVKELSDVEAQALIEDLLTVDSGAPIEQPR